MSVKLIASLDAIYFKLGAKLKGNYGIKNAIWLCITY